jgi:predicted dinucleotide-binding enzyme
MKKIGILGTGMVGNTIGSKLVEKGYEVKMGSRTVTNEKAAAWTASAGKGASHGTFAEAAAFGELLFNCTGGNVSIDVLRSAGMENLDGKILIDLANPLDFSNGFPPSLTASLSNTTSLGEEIQKAFPEVKVVKTLNTMNCALMADASKVKGDHDVFMCGNDASAKETVSNMLAADFGWKSIIDLGDISGARGTEMILPLWLRLYSTGKSPDFNFRIVK